MRRVVLVGVLAGATIGAAVIIRRQRSASARLANGQAEWPPLQATARLPVTHAPAPRAGAVPPWVDALDGQCPATHPVKGNANSGIYHLPGGRFYQNTKAERCFLDAAAAEADGYRASKR